MVISDLSSDVCSSDLRGCRGRRNRRGIGILLQQRLEARVVADRVPSRIDAQMRGAYPPQRPAVLRLQRHVLSKGVDGCRLLTQGQLDQSQGNTFIEVGV